MEENNSYLRSMNTDSHIKCLVNKICFVENKSHWNTNMKGILEQGIPIIEQYNEKIPRKKVYLEY